MAEKEPDKPQDARPPDETPEAPPAEDEPETASADEESEQASAPTAGDTGPAGAAAPADEDDSGPPGSLAEILAAQRAELDKGRKKAEQPPAEPPAQEAPAHADEPAQEADESKPQPGASGPAGAAGGDAGDEAAAAAQNAPAAKSADTRPFGGAKPAGRAPASPRRSVLVPALLTVNTALVVLLLAGWIFCRPGAGPVPAAGGRQARPAPAPRPQPKGEPAEASGRAETTEPLPSASWAKAEQYYAEQKYDQALTEYARLREARRHVPRYRLLLDYFLWRIAECQRRQGELEAARDTLMMLTGSRSGALRAVANYNLAVLDLQSGQYLQARRKAYHAAAGLASMEMPLPLGARAQYLVAAALTRKVVAFYRADDPIPWPAPTWATPFLALEAARIRGLVADGAVPVEEADAAGGLRITRREGPGRRWDVDANQVPLEDLVHQLAAATCEEVRWASVPPRLRPVPIRMWLRNVTAHRAIELACGQAGLVARFAWETVTVHDPQSAESMYAQRDLLTSEARSTWRRYFLQGRDPHRIPVGHFALACLLELSEAKADALREYELIAGRFGRHRVAPLSLLRSAEVLRGLGNFADARRTLVNLLDRFPDFPLSDEVYLRLGRLNLESGHPDEAFRVFHKAYTLNLSPASTLTACVEAGRTRLRQGRHAEASRWLTRAIARMDTPQWKRRAEVYLLLGGSEAAQGHLDAAAGALERVLHAHPAPSQRVEALLRLVEVRRRQADLVRAVEVMAQLEGQDLSVAQRCEKVRAQGRLYRDMQLPARAVTYLQEQAKTFHDPQHWGGVQLELARCLQADERPREAARILRDVLPRLPAGPLAHEVQCELAACEVASGKGGRAVPLLEALLQTDAAPRVRQRAARMLGDLRLADGAYARAAAAYLAAAGTQTEGQEP